ncbi:hypothetical protein C0J52_04688 [Blattella germanica]|nr:hypothetical protein C0J52_04688 [Blattella germanica]
MKLVKTFCDLKLNYCQVSSLYADEDSVSESPGPLAEEACSRAGGMCLPESECPAGRLNPKKGLCPMQQSAGIECCHSLQRVGNSNRCHSTTLDHNFKSGANGRTANVGLLVNCLLDLHNGYEEELKEAELEEGKLEEHEEDE